MLNFIVNPNARKGKIKKLIAKIEERLKEYGAEYRFFYSEQEGGLRKYANALTSAGETNIIAVGGDGSLNEVLCGISDPSKTVLGLIPAGTGNDFAAAARIPAGVAAVDLILRGEPQYVDYLECNEGMRSINIAGLGIDTDILRRCAKMKGTQRSKYFFSLIASLCTFKGIRIKVRVGETWTEHTAMIAAACNGSQFGGGIPFCPPAVIDDGKMEFVVVDCPKRSKIPFELIHLMKGKLMGRPITSCIQCEEAEIVPEKRGFVQYDGELREADSLHVRLVTRQLRMFRG